MVAPMAQAAATMVPTNDNSDLFATLDWRGLLDCAARLAPTASTPNTRHAVYCAQCAVICQEVANVLFGHTVGSADDQRVNDAFGAIVDADRQSRATHKLKLELEAILSSNENMDATAFAERVQKATARVKAAGTFDTKQWRDVTTFWIALSDAKADIAATKGFSELKLSVCCGVLIMGPRLVRDKNAVMNAPVLNSDQKHTLKDLYTMQSASALPLPVPAAAPTEAPAEAPSAPTTAAPATLEVPAAPAAPAALAAPAAPAAPAALAAPAAPQAPAPPAATSEAPAALAAHDPFEQAAPQHGVNGEESSVMSAATTDDGNDDDDDDDKDDKDDDESAYDDDDGIDGDYEPDENDADDEDAENDVDEDGVARGASATATNAATTTAATSAASTTTAAAAASSTDKRKTNHQADAVAYDADRVPFIVAEIKQHRGRGERDRRRIVYFLRQAADLRRAMGKPPRATYGVQCIGLQVSVTKMIELPSGLFVQVVLLKIDFESCSLAEAIEFLVLMWSIHDEKEQLPKPQQRSSTSVANSAPPTPNSASKKAK
jgi:hypothetical protein